LALAKICPVFGINPVFVILAGIWQSLFCLFLCQFGTKAKICQNDKFYLLATFFCETASYALLFSEKCLKSRVCNRNAGQKKEFTPNFVFFNTVF